MIELYVEKRESSKTKKEYIALYASLGYGNDLMLTIDPAQISQIVDMKIRELAELPLNEKIIIGKLEK